MNKEQATEFVKSYIEKMNTQDCRGTASPYFYVIRTAEYFPSDSNYEYGRVTYIRHDDNEIYFSVDDEVDALDKFRIHLADFYENDIYKTAGKEFLEELLSEEYYVCYEKKIWREESLFFTESDAENHLRNNAHHYSWDAHTYVKYAWRAPELEEFLKSVGVMCGVELEIK